MGCYVNPPNMTKEAWLSKNGESVDGPFTITETHVPVCLVDNGLFKAAGVAYDQSEVEAFDDPDDYRPKLWYKVEREKLRTVSDLEKYEKRS